ncbi:hypothetical protein NQ317_017007 [Molorchus minor]|uniref:Uncharacterized protein n=1 Tax=Molorchus minor TaxID=1323400 RepID=A0ABQ9IUT5_9CUCU|nr:hypothetical protein NQ317_017007 [Molorchus minor]
MSYKGGATGNLIRHLKLVHPTILTKYEKETSSKSQTVGHPEGESSTSTSTSITTAMEMIINPSSAEETDTPLPKKTRSEKQSSLSSFIKQPLTDRKTQEIHNELVKLLVKNYLPLQLVDSEYFCSFVRKLNNSYQVPSRKTISNTLLPQLHNMAQQNVRNSLENIKACCLTTDGWTSCANKSFIGITAHYITKDNKMQSSLLDCYEYSDRHTAENLCTELKRISREWNVHDKIIAVASDNASNIVAAIKLTGWKHVPCFAHTLNLIVQSALEINSIAQMQQKIKKIVTFFKHSPQACGKLTAMQLQLGKTVLSLKQDCVTRWNSTFDMFNRVLEVKESLMSVIAINYPENLNINNNDIIIIQGICDVLKLFKDVTEEMSSEKQVTASKVILLIKELGQKLLENLTRRFNLIEENKIYAEATFLDPRFKRHGFSKDSAFETIKQSIIAQATAIIILEQEKEDSAAEVVCETRINDSDNTKISIWKDFDEKVSNLVQKK